MDVTPLLSFVLAEVSDVSGKGIIRLMLMMGAITLVAAFIVWALGKMMSAVPSALTNGIWIAAGLGCLLLALHYFGLF